jgi:type IV secretory pathway VirB9-like protein
MLSLFPKGKTNVNGINIGDIASRLDNIQILSTEEKDIIEKLRKETSSIHTKNGYEELIRVREDGEKTTIYFRDKKNEKKEFVLLSDGKDEFTIISITGDLTLQEIQGIIAKEE